MIDSKEYELNRLRLQKLLWEAEQQRLALQSREQDTHGPLMNKPRNTIATTLRSLVRLL